MQRLAIFALALGLNACVVDNQAASPDGAAAETDRGVGGTLDARPAPDQAPAPDGSPGQDAAEDAGPDPCTTACATLARCAGEQCPGLDADQAASLTAGCAAECAGRPAFATVINGAGGCQTVIDFARDQSPDFAAACAGPGQAPTPCRVTAECAADQSCRDGLCRPAQFASCRDAADCDGEGGQACRNFSANPLDPGNCQLVCADDAACPLNQRCFLEYGGICYFALCGADSGNGQPFEPCTVGDRGGVCYPLQEGQRTPAGLQGICLEGGEAPLGAACDAQAESRRPEDVALRCAEGVCFGDPDDPSDPDALLDGQGSCVALCDPNAPACAEGTTCFDFSSPDDPATPEFDETQYIGACLPSDCSALADPAQDCGPDRACRLYSALSDGGLCGPAGEGAPGAPCQAAEDCAGNQICGGVGVCIPICDLAAEAPCAEGEICYAEATWAVGFCIEAPEAP